MLLTDGTRATIEGNTFSESGGIVIHGLAAPALTNNEFIGSNGISLIEAADDITVSGNVFRDVARFAIGVCGPGSPIIEANTIEGASEQGIIVGPSLSDGVAATIRDNTITSSGTGIVVIDVASVKVEGNTLADNGTGIVAARANAEITDNTITGGDHGLWLDDSSLVVDNDVRGAGIGVHIGPGVSPTLIRTTVCGNITNLDVGREASPVFKRKKRHICADEA